METRTGMGYDVHQLKLHDADTPPSQQHIKLCGVKIPFTHYLVGHSDADVGLHALVDAILGAIGAGDIGMHFPPDDRKWQGADSERFLLHAYELLTNRGGELVHLDVTLICERPKIAPYREQMVAHIAQMLKFPPDRVSIKATTTEKLGFTGRGEGIAAQAVATVRLPRLCMRIGRKKNHLNHDLVVYRHLVRLRHVAVRQRHGRLDRRVAVRIRHTGMLRQCRPVRRIADYFCFIGWWASNQYLKATGRDDDPREIVVDEVAGQWLLLAVLFPTWHSYLVGFILFRLFDIAKPWPVSVADRKIKGGIGVMFDDMLAALYPIGVYLDSSSSKRNFSARKNCCSRSWIF